MADENNNTDSKTTTKPETADQAKTAPKAKAKPKVKASPKAAAKSTAKTADAAPYLKKGSNTESSNTQSTERKSLTPMVLLLIFAALIITTVYKFNEERNNVTAQTDTQEYTVPTEPTSVAMEQTTTDNGDIETTTAPAPEQQVQITHQKTEEQAVGQAEAQVAVNDDLIQQRRQAYEKEIQLKQQQFKALMEARQKERAEVIAKQKAELQRIKQKQLETRMKAQAIQKQILELHEKLHQLMRQAHAPDRP